MADRSVSVRLRLKIKEFEAGANGVKKNLTGLNKKFAETAGFAQGFRRKLEDATKKLPKIDIDANSKPADIKIAELRSKLEELSKKEIGVDIDASQALVEMAALQRELEAAEDGASFDVKADISRALADLDAVNREIQRIDGQKVEIDIEADRTFADRLRNQVELAARSLPKIQLDADSTPAQRRIAELRTALVGLADKRIGVDLDAAAAMAQIAAIERELADLSKSNEIDIRADAGSALAELRAVSSEVARVDGRTARINVNADVAGALTNIALVGAALASLPAVTSIAVGVGALGGAFAAAGAGAAGFAAVAVPSLGRINEALKQQETAAGGAGGATKSAAQSAAEAASRALQLEQAERRVADAQKGVKQAQEDLTRARQDAKRALEDYALSVKDAALAEEDAALSVEEARARLAEVQADPEATELERQRAELSYRQAVQRLEDQRVRTKRLQEDKAEADRKGIEGSDQVRAAQDKLLKSQADLAEAQKQLTVLQLQQKAALQQTGGAAGGAASKFAELSKREQALAKDVKKFQDSYVEWQRSLQPDVFPVIRSGMDLMTTGMKLGTPVIKSSAAAFNEFLQSVNTELKSQEWKDFFDDLAATAPGVIDRLGDSAISVGNGLRGVIEAFLPYSNDLLDIVVKITDKFEAWGEGLGDSPEFKAFIAYVQENGPKVAEVFSNIATFAGKIAGVGADLGPGVLDFMVTLSERLAGMDPAQIEAIAKGVGLVFAAVKLGSTLKLGALVLLADVLSGMSPSEIQAIAFAIAATVTAVKGYQTVSGAVEWWKSLSGSLDKAGGSADTAKGKLSGLSGTLKAGGIAAIVAGAAIAVDKLGDSLAGLNPDIDGLATHMSDLSAKGKPTSAMLGEFGSNLDTLAGDMARSSTWFAPVVGQFESLGDTVGRLVSDNPFQQFGNEITTMADSVTGDLYSMDTGRQRLENFDKTLTAMVQSGNSQQAAALFNELAKQAGLAGGDVDKLKQLLPGYSGAVKSAQEATKPTGDALRDVGTNAGNAATNIDTLRTAIGQLTGLTQTALQAEINYKRAVDNAAASIKENGRAHDTNTEAGRRNREALIGLAEKANDYRQALIDQGTPISEVNEKLATQRDRFITLAEKMGFSRKQAEELATKLGLIPGNVTTDVKTPGGKEALDLIKEYERKLKELDGKTATVRVRVETDGSVRLPGNLKASPNAAGGIHRYATGGIDYAAAGGLKARPQPPGIASKPTILFGEGSSGRGATEAFIPYEARYRDQAVALLGQVANDFGLQLNNQQAAQGLSDLSVTIDDSGLRIVDSLTGVMGSLQDTMGQAGTLTSSIARVGASADQLNASWLEGSAIVGDTMTRLGTVTSDAVTVMTGSVTTSVDGLTSSVDALAAAVGAAKQAASSASSKSSSGKKNTKPGMVAGSGPKSSDGFREEYSVAGSYGLDGPGYVSTHESAFVTSRPVNYSQVSAPQQSAPSSSPAPAERVHGTSGAWGREGMGNSGPAVVIQNQTVNSNVDANLFAESVAMKVRSRGR